MTLTPLNNLQDAKLDPQVEYRALVRSLKYPEGFGLLFVQCAPAKGEELIAQIRQDLPKKHVEVLSLTEPIENLHERVDTLYRKQSIDVLFIRGIEHSLYDYEKNRLWDDDAQRLSYSETGAPRLLQHLNLSRERFRESFPFCFVFLIPYFALKYFSRRAPDFFDWNSGVLEFSMCQEQLQQQSERTIIERSLRSNQWDLNPSECRNNLLIIQSLIEELFQTEELRAKLFLEQGRLFFLLEEFEQAKTSFDKTLLINPSYSIAWNNRGSVLTLLGRIEEAIISFKKALELKPDYYKAWDNLSIALDKLGRYEEAVNSYNKAIEIEPDDYPAWNNKGVILYKLGRYEEAVASYSKAIESKPDESLAWYNRGIALGKLGLNKQEIDSYDNALKYKSDYSEAWYCRGIALDALGLFEEAIFSFDKAIQFKPDDYQALYNRAFILNKLNLNKEAIISVGKALDLNPKDSSAWYLHGKILYCLAFFEEAITNFDNALAINLDYPDLFYNKASWYALQTDIEAAIENLTHAIALNPGKNRDMAKTDSDFDSICHDKRFQALINGI
jgi:tetratricopeptide (TPR) repeat protein